MNMLDNDKVGQVTGDANSSTFTILLDNDVADPRDVLNFEIAQREWDVFERPEEVWQSHGRYCLRYKIQSDSERKKYNSEWYIFCTFDSKSEAEGQLESILKYNQKVIDCQGGE